MTLTPDQLQQLLDIVRVQLVAFAGTTLGPQVLSSEEHKLLSDAGLDVSSLYDQSEDPVLLNFHLGLISQAIGQTNASHITFEQLKRYISSTQYIPLTARELRVLHSIKTQALGDIRSHQGKIFQDVNQVVNHHTNHTARQDQEEFLRTTIVQEFEKHKTVKQISTELAKLTGDWSRNFFKSVQYISHTALNEGRLAMIERREGHSGHVYFIVQPGACDHCVRLYLTNGEGSAPRLFTTQQLLSHGTNIGKRTDEWQATVGPIHVHCRCLLTEYISGETWQDGMYRLPKDTVHVPVVNRKKVKIQFNGQEYLV
jgi:hypothetical protein